MLHRSFKPVKCKIDLKLASARTKILKNKKQGAYKQLKLEVSKLLESGQDQNARIRVEHVIREEKMIEAYELIEVYCDLIVARLSIFESQKNCPIDLKEAITGVIFAAPRCADIPELLEVRKHFKAKYGKEFVASAAELRPNCGVNGMLIEKLSAIKPDIQTKMKVLKAIAEEHNIKWNPDALEEKDGKPADEVLSANKIYVEPPIVQTPPLPPPEKSHDLPPVISSEDGSSSSSSSQIPSSHTGSSETTYTTSHAGPKPSGFFFAEAAQAAAEAAERATMAAKAAAELSDKEKLTKQHSTESQNPPVHSVKIEEDRFDHAGSKLQEDSISMNPSEKTEDEMLVPLKVNEYSPISPSDVMFSNPIEKFNESENRDDMKTEVSNCLEEGEIITESRIDSPGSHSSIFIDDHEPVVTPNQDKFENDFGHELFVNVDHVIKETSTISAYFEDHDVLAFDDYGSDHNDNKFTEEDIFNKPESTFFTSPSINYSSISEQNKGNFSASAIFETHPFTESPEVSEDQVKSEEFTEPVELPPVTFDQSDGSGSEIEEELVKYSSDEHDVLSTNHKSPRRAEKTQIDSGDFDDVKPWKAPKLSWAHESKKNDKLSNGDLSSDESNTLKYGKLSGGLRNKGYIKSGSSSSSDASSDDLNEELASQKKGRKVTNNIKSSKKEKKSHYRASDSSETESDDSNGDLASQKKTQKATSSKKKGTSFDSDVQNQKMSRKKKKQSYVKAPVISSDSDSDDVVEAPSKKTVKKLSSYVVSSDSDSQKQKIRTKREKRTGTKPPVTSSDSDSDDINGKMASKKTGRKLNEAGSNENGTQDKKVNTKKEKKSIAKAPIISSDSDTEDLFSKKKGRKITSLANSSDSDSENLIKELASQKTSQKVTYAASWIDSETENKKVVRKKEKKMFVQAAHVTSSDSDNDDFNEEPISKKSSPKLSNATTSKGHKKSYSKAPPSTSSDSDSEDLAIVSDAKKQKMSTKSEKKHGDDLNKEMGLKLSDSKDNLPQQSLSSQVRLGGGSNGFSRRTKASPINLEKNSYPKVNVVLQEEEPLKITDANEKASSAESNKPRISKFEKPPSPFVGKTSSIEQPISSKPLSDEGPKTESTEIGSEKITSAENSMKNASHVHPNLPDYDSFAAHFESLRSNQK